MNERAKVKGSDVLGNIATDSFNTMSNTFSNWMRNANRMQAETVRFMSERFDKDMRAFARFGECRKPEDFAAIHNELVTQMVNDYMEEGAKLVALFGDLAQSAVNDSAKAAKKP